MPERILIPLHLFIRNILILSRETLKVLFARMARNLSGSNRVTWEILASTVGGILIKSEYKARMQNLALKARNGLVIEKSRGVRPGDLLLLGVMFCLMTLLLMW